MKRISSPAANKMLKEVLWGDVNDNGRTLKTPGMKKTNRNFKSWGNKKDYFSPLKLSKTCITIESKVLTLLGRIYSMYVDVIYVTTIKYRDI